MTVARQRPFERYRYGVGVFDPNRVRCLHVEMRLRAVAGVSALSERLLDHELLAKIDSDASVAKMAQEDDGTSRVNCNVVTGKGTPAWGCSFPFPEGITEGSEPSIGGMVSEAVISRNDYSVQWAVDQSAKARKLLRRL